MAATNGTLDFTNGRDHKLINVYVSNVAAEAVTMRPDGKAVAGSPAFFFMPGPAYLHDISLDADPSTVTNIVVKVNDNAVAVLGVKNHLASVTSRPRPNILIRQGQKLTLIQE